MTKTEKIDINRITLSYLVTDLDKDITLVSKPVVGPVETHGELCNGCYYETNFKGCRAAPPCSSLVRQDKQDIIWVEQK